MSVMGSVEEVKRQGEIVVPGDEGERGRRCRAVSARSLERCLRESVVGETSAVAVAAPPVDSLRTGVPFAVAPWDQEALGSESDGGQAADWRFRASWVAM
jgi:hypothetical protein